MNIQSLKECADGHIIPTTLKNGIRDDKKKFLAGLPGSVVDKFIINKEAVSRAVKQQLDLEEERSKLVKTADGKFKCQEPSCPKTFQYNGKRKKDHEAKAHGVV